MSIKFPKDGNGPIVNGKGFASTGIHVDPDATPVYAGRKESGIKRLLSRAVGAFGQILALSSATFGFVMAMGNEKNPSEISQFVKPIVDFIAPGTNTHNLETIFVLGAACLVGVVMAVATMGANDDPTPPNGGSGATVGKAVEKSPKQRRTLGLS